MADEPFLVAVAEGVALSHAGDRATARIHLQRLWDSLGPQGDPLHRCALAHAMADVQDDPLDELGWDQRALAACGELTDERVARAGITGGAAGFLPSLHLNLADVHQRLGRRANAAEHLRSGLAALDSLTDDGYREMIRAGLDRIAARL